MPTFPAYGKNLSFNKTAQKPPVHRTEMERGSAKQTTAYSLQPMDYSVSYVYSNAEYATWETWWRSTINKGASWFDWVNPFTGATVQGRIKEGSFTASPYSKSGTHVLVSLTIEVME